MQVINFFGKVDLQNVRDLLIDLRTKKDAHHYVCINSNGGFINALSVFEHSLESMRFTAVAGKVYSAAIILFLYGQERLAFADTTFFFHEVGTTLEDGRWMTISEVGKCIENYSDASTIYGKIPDEIATIYHEMQETQEWMIDFIVQRSTITDGELRHLMDESTMLTAQEALEYGIVDRIISRDEFLNIIC